MVVVDDVGRSLTYASLVRVDDLLCPAPFCGRIKTSSSAVAQKPRWRVGSVLGRWWVMAWVRQYSAPNVAGARILKALMFYTINPLL